MLKALILFITLLLINGSTALAAQEITVSGMVELLNSIGSDRTIYLNPGEYKLDDALGFTSRNGQNIYGRSMQIADVNNLKIIGLDPDKTKLLSPYSDSDVLIIKNCNNIELQNFSIGHVQRPKGCEGDALSIELSQSVRLDHMDVYGCGEDGLTLRNVDQLEVKDSYIHNCTYNLLDMDTVSYSKFINTRFLHDGSFSVMAAKGHIQNLTFQNCQFVVDSQRKVSASHKGTEAEYAAKYSLMAERFSKKWPLAGEVRFKDCEFDQVNPVEIEALKNQGVAFTECKLKGQDI
jgi:pectate lyase